MAPALTMGLCGLSVGHKTKSRELNGHLCAFIVEMGNSCATKSVTSLPVCEIIFLSSHLER